MNNHVEDTNSALEGIEDVHALTPTQAGMLYHSVSSPQGGTYVGQVSMQLRGRLDPEAFKRAWQDVIRAYPILRTSFPWDGLDEPLAMVETASDAPWEQGDWTGVENLDAHRDAWLAADRARGVPTDRAPLMRFALFRLGAARWQFVWTAHHMILDGWSSALVLQDVWAAYRAQLNGTPRIMPPRPPFREFVEWSADQSPDASDGYWKAHLNGFEEKTPLIIESPVAEKAGRAQVIVRLSADATRAIEAMARSHRVTLNTVLLGAWALVLARRADTEDVVFGWTTSGRSAPIRGIDAMIGLLINTLPVRVKVDEAEPVAAFLAALQEQHNEATRHEHASLARIQSECGWSRSMFDSLLVFEKFPENATGSIEGLTVETTEPIDQSHYPLAILVHPSHELELIGVYDGATFSADGVDGILRELSTVLEALPRAVDEPLARVPSLSPGLEARVIAHARGVAIDAQLWPETETITAMIEEASRRSPTASAVACGSRSISYEVLWRQAETIARQLSILGVGPGIHVAVCMSRSVDLIVAIIGILRSGAAYVPIDPEYPEGHRQHVLTDAGAGHIIADESTRPMLEGGDVNVLAFASLLEAPLSEMGAELRMSGPNDPAYVIYTSGSTGRPKGVVVRHRNLVASTVARHQAYPEAPRSFLLMSSVLFDSSVAGLFWTLTTGGLLVVSEPKLEQDLDRLGKTVAAHGVTHTLMLPALYRVLLAETDVARLSSLRVVIVAGEAVAAPLVQEHQQSMPRAALYNEYGPTEATVWATVHELTLHEGANVPIGRPIPGASVYALDRKGRLQSPGVPGELFIGGQGVAAGYHGDPERTADRFVDDPFEPGGRLYRTGDLGAVRNDGTVLFIGRRDHQVKLRGHRIELGGVEARLLELPDVKSAVAVVRTNQRGDERMIAYVAASDSFDKADAMARLANMLPPFMLPSDLVALNALPLTPNQKVDRNALPEPSADAWRSGDRVLPRNDVEARVAAIWKSMLHVDDLSVDDDFFKVGGHSLLTFQLLRDCEREFSARVSLGRFLSDPTVSGLSRALRGDGDQAERALVPLQTRGTGTPVYCLCGISLYSELAERLGQTLPVFAMYVPEEDAVFSDREEAGVAFERLTQAYYDFIVEHHPGGPLSVLGYCFGGALAFEVAKKAEANGLEVEALILIDAVVWPNLRRRNWNRAKALVSRFVEAGPGPILERLFERVGREASVDASGNPAEPLTNRDRILSLAARMMDYVPGASVDARTVIVSSNDAGIFNTWARTRLLGWERHLSGRTQTFVMPGTHTSILSEPTVDLLAEQLKLALTSSSS